jgi:hypothetical protein
LNLWPSLCQWFPHLYWYQHHQAHRDCVLQYDYITPFTGKRWVTLSYFSNFRSPFCDTIVLSSPGRGLARRKPVFFNVFCLVGKLLWLCGAFHRCCSSHFHTIYFNINVLRWNRLTVVMPYDVFCQGPPTWQNTLENYEVSLKLLLIVSVVRDKKFTLTCPMQHQIFSLVSSKDTYFIFFKVLCHVDRPL